MICPALDHDLLVDGATTTCRFVCYAYPVESSVEDGNVVEDTGTCWSKKWLLPIFLT